ncbi:MAG: ATP synthase F1 subunit gamma [Clostridia bacterium]|nr:ATP synthase F1 subunit gamma [Clostridia bacterium]
MPQNLRDIRRRIRSVTNTQQITKAMQMVAAAKLRGAQERAEAARPYAEAMREALTDLTARGGAFRHPFFQVRDVRRSAFVVISADKGLAGPYNANVLRAALAAMRDRPKPLVLAVGRKARDAFRRLGVEIAESFIELGDHPSFETAHAIAVPAMDLYLDGRADEVYLVYNRFVNAVTHRPTVIRLLPLAAEARGGERKLGPEVQFEPDAESVLAALLPHYVSSILYGALLDAKASEHGARMTAMDAATKNARELIDSLTLLSNRVRQASITKEISEIVSGAEALKG